MIKVKNIIAQPGYVVFSEFIMTLHLAFGKSQTLLSTNSDRSLVHVI
jgi:hypothetical protein